MEIKWVEDFLSAAETLNFSKSARLRNVTQPAFSRRIQSLENWLGVELFDRVNYPTRLTRAGETFQIRAVEMLDHLLNTRSILKQKRTDLNAEMVCAMPHTLSLTYFPKWLSEMEGKLGMLTIQVIAANVHDAITALTDGGCDVLISYRHPYEAVEMDMARYEMVRIGSESMRPYSKPDSAGSALFRLPGNLDRPIPHLAYPETTSFGKIVSNILKGSPQPLQIFRRYEGDMAEGLRMMALQGHGVAWLPASLAAQDLASGALVPAYERDGIDRREERWSGEMDICIYRDRARANPFLDKLWQCLPAATQHRLGSQVK